MSNQWQNLRLCAAQPGQQRTAALVQIMKTSQIKPDEQLTFAMNDIRETMRHHVFGSPYHNKLMREYDEILEQMSQNCIREYHKRYGE